MTALAIEHLKTLEQKLNLIFFFFEHKRLCLSLKPYYKNLTENY